MDAAGDVPSGRPDDGKVISLKMPGCETSGTVCVGVDVHSCVDHQPGVLVESCPDACSLGRCTTAACAMTERNDGVRGCRFYGVQMDNVDYDDGRSLMVLLSNADAVPVRARIEVRDSDGAWVTTQADVINVLGGTRIEIARPVLDVGVTVGGAYRVDTEGPVTAVQIVSDDADRKSRSSGGTVLRPAQAIGFDYLALTSSADGSEAVLETPGSRGGAATITVIATVANTNVHLALTAPAMVSEGGIVDSPPLSYDVPPMQEGDVLQIFSTTPGGDLTGSRVTADFPIAVFSGNVFTSYGYASTGANGGDLVVEQLPPTASWGLAYVGARLSPQIGCDPFFGQGVGHWRVIAAEDTVVTISPAVGVSVDGPNLPTDLKFSLGAAQSQSFWTRGDIISVDGVPRSTIPADFVATAAPGAILLAQWLDCEPSLSWGIDGRLSGGEFPFTLPPGFDHEVIVLKEIGHPLKLDGRTLDAARFRAVSPTSKYEAARLGPMDLGPCDDALDRCEHYLSGSAFGVTWRGMDVVCSYAVTVPSGDSCALPNVICPP